jgi:hypothetical protein
MEEDNNTDSASALPKTISWQVPEHEELERDKRWYVVASTIAVIFIIYALFTGNFLFAVIVILASFIIVLLDGQVPRLISIRLAGDGVSIGSKIYDYDNLKNFSIVYKPKLEVKNLYIEFKSSVKHRLSLPLQDMNPLPIRKYLLQYLPEDTERVNQPLSEGLGKLFKI